MSDRGILLDRLIEVAKEKGFLPQEARDVDAYKEVVHGLVYAHLDTENTGALATDKKLRAYILKLTEIRTKYYEAVLKNDFLGAYSYHKYLIGLSQAFEKIGFCPVHLDDAYACHIQELEERMFTFFRRLLDSDFQDTSGFSSASIDIHFRNGKPDFYIICLYLSKIFQEGHLDSLDFETQREASLLVETLQKIVDTIMPHLIAFFGPEVPELNQFFYQHSQKVILEKKRLIDENIAHLQQSLVDFDVEACTKAYTQLIEIFTHAIPLRLFLEEYEICQSISERFRYFAENIAHRQESPLQVESEEVFSLDEAYDILGISQGVSFSQLQEAYKNALMKVSAEDARGKETIIHAYNFIKNVLFSHLHS